MIAYSVAVGQEGQQPVLIFYFYDLTGLREYSRQEAAADFEASPSPALTPNIG